MFLTQTGFFRILRLDFDLAGRAGQTGRLCLRNARAARAHRRKDTDRKEWWNMKKKFLLLDSGIIAQIQSARLRLGEVQKYGGNPLFMEEYFAVPPKKWEVRYDNGYPNVFYDPQIQKYRCYYTLFLRDEDSESASLQARVNRQYQPLESRVTGLCYAESADGLHWEKPNLGLVEFEGSRDNNILMEYAHGTSVLYDPEDPDPQRRYKMMTRSDKLDRVAVSFSADGIHWEELTPWPEHNPAADTHNFVFRNADTGKFVFITRVWNNGLRVVARSESQDFLHWSDPIEIYRGCGFEDQIYSMPVFRCGPVYLGLASIYHGGDTDSPDYDRVDCRLTYSTDTVHWDRVLPGENLIPRARGTYPGPCDSGCIYASVPVTMPDGSMRFYYMGGNGQHTNFRETGLCLCTLPADHFAGYEPVSALTPGMVQTRFCIQDAVEICVTADVSEGGFVKVELIEANGAETLLGELRQSEIAKPFELPHRVGNDGAALRFTLYRSKIYSFDSLSCAEDS